jgi:hypothetical protein
VRAIAREESESERKNDRERCIKILKTAISVHNTTNLSPPYEALILHISIEWFHLKKL